MSIDETCRSLADDQRAQPQTEALANRDVFRRQAQVLKALAHESRLMIVDRLYRSEASAGQLTELVGSDQTTVSKHLAILRAHGIVDSRREGNVVIYELITPCVVNFISCATNVMVEIPRTQVSGDALGDPRRAGCNEGSWSRARH